jgi:hypothetical protein
MNNKQIKSPPRWLFLALTIGSLLASGIYIGKIVFLDAAAGSILQAVIFGVLGVLWLLMAHRINK